MEGALLPPPRRSPATGGPAERSPWAVGAGWREGSWRAGFVGWFEPGRESDVLPDRAPVNWRFWCSGWRFFRAKLLRRRRFSKNRSTPDGASTLDARARLGAEGRPEPDSRGGLSGVRRDPQRLGERHSRRCFPDRFALEGRDGRGADGLRPGRASAGQDPLLGDAGARQSVSAPTTDTIIIRRWKWPPG